MAGAAGLTALLPAPANAKEIKGREVSFATPDGTTRRLFRRDREWLASGGTGVARRHGHPARVQADSGPAGASGYAVLTLNPFYRSVQGQFRQPGESFDQPAVREKVGPWRALLTPDAVVSDAPACFGFIDNQAEVDVKLGAVTTGIAWAARARCAPRPR